MKALLLSLIFTVSANAVTFESWITAQGLSGADAHQDADPDKDRFSNLVEYALYGLNPTVADSGAVTTFGFAPAAQDGSFGDAETAPPWGAPRSWHHALVYRLRANTEGISVYPQISHECPATRNGGDMLYWLGEGGRGDSLLMVYTRADGKLQAMSRARGHLQQRAFMRLKIERDGGTRMPVTEGAVTPFLGLTTGPLRFVPRVVGSTSTSNVTDRDVTYQQVTRPQTVHDVSWPWNVGSTSLNPGDVTRSFSPSGIVTLGGSVDAWTYQAPGQVTLTLTTPTRVYSQTVSLWAIGEQITRTLTGSTSGSLRAHMVAQTDTRAAPYAGIQERARLWSTWHPGVSYTRNANCWGSGIDLTPIATWNSESAAYGNSWRGQTLISPRHYIGAAHWAVSVGTTLHFVTSDNVTVARTITAVQLIPGTDIIVGVLNSDVPGSISFARVLPDAWSAKLPTLSAALPVPVARLDRGQQIWITDLYTLTGPGDRGVDARAPTLQGRISFYRAAENGDSGSPMFAVIDSKVVLLCALYGGGGGSGPFITAHRAAINAAMATLGGGYTLTDADLSAFTSY